MKKKILEVLAKAKARTLALTDKAIEKTTVPFMNLFVKHIKRDDKKQMNRRLLLVASLVIMLDYLLICYHVGRNPLDIIPGIPKLEGRSEVSIFVTDLDGKSLLKEKRLIDKDDTKENIARELVNFILKGSNYENTKVAVPISGSVRKIWFFEDKCVVDFRCEIIPDEVDIISGSEDYFRKAITETIKENIPGVNTVIISENGVPGKKLWEPFKEELASVESSSMELKKDEKPL